MKHDQDKGWPGIPPEVHFRRRIIGFFAGIQSRREIAWRRADRVSLHRFLVIPLTASTPDPSWLAHRRERLHPEVPENVLEWVLRVAVEKKLQTGKTVAIDSSTSEADAAAKSIVRRDT